MPDEPTGRRRGQPRMGTQDPGPPKVNCSRAWDHEGHFWISAIAGGSPGPIPQITCWCSGVGTPYPSGSD